MFLNFYIIFCIEMWRFVFDQCLMFKRFSMEEAFSSLIYFHSGQVSDSSVAEIQMDAFLTNIRKLISDTCYIILIYMSVIIIKELLATVIWLYLKRLGSEHRHQWLLKLWIIQFEGEGLHWQCLLVLSNYSFWNDISSQFISY